MQLLTVIVCIYPYNWHHLEEHLGLRFSQSHVSSVPTSSFQIQPIHIDTFQRRVCDIILHPFSDLIAQHYTVKSPPFVSPCYFLPKTDESMEVTFSHVHRAIFSKHFLEIYMYGDNLSSSIQKNSIFMIFMFTAVWLLSKLVMVSYHNKAFSTLSTIFYFESFHYIQYLKTVPSNMTAECPWQLAPANMKISQLSWDEKTSTACAKQNSSNDKTKTPNLLHIFWSYLPFPVPILFINRV